MKKLFIFASSVILLALAACEKNDQPLRDYNNVTFNTLEATFGQNGETIASEIESAGWTMDYSLVSNNVYGYYKHSGNYIEIFSFTVQLNSGEITGVSYTKGSPYYTADRIGDPNDEYHEKGLDAICGKDLLLTEINRIMTNYTIKDASAVIYDRYGDYDSTDKDVYYDSDVEKNGEPDVDDFTSVIDNFEDDTYDNSWYDYESPCCSMTAKFLNNSNSTTGATISGGLYYYSMTIGDNYYIEY